jgi:serine/threonine protein phosphatase PrpC
MHDPSISRHGHDDSGSTASLALISPCAVPSASGSNGSSDSSSSSITGWRLAVANLGDSRALLVGADGSVQELSEVHNTGNPSELERLLAAGAQVVHPQSGAPTAALADGHARFFPKGPIWGKRGLKVSR